jgi:hypothetical protein
VVDMIGIGWKMTEAKRMVETKRKGLKKRSYE